MIFCLFEMTTGQFKLIKIHEGPASAVVWKKTTIEFNGKKAGPYLRYTMP